MSDDLVKRLDNCWEMLEDEGFYTKASTVMLAKQRIEELEAKLAKVKEAFRINMMDALPDYTHEMFDKDYAKIIGETDA